MGFIWLAEVLDEFVSRARWDGKLLWWQCPSYTCMISIRRSQPYEWWDDNNLVHFNATNHAFRIFIAAARQISQSSWWDPNEEPSSWLKIFDCRAVCRFRQQRTQMWRHFGLRSVPFHSSHNRRDGCKTDPAGAGTTIKITSQQLHNIVPGALLS